MIPTMIIVRNFANLSLSNSSFFPPTSECPESGIFENSLCTQNSTASVSFPHFMYAHPTYTKHVKGLAPDPQSHSFFLDVDPVSAFGSLFDDSLSNLCESHIVRASSQ